MRNEIELRPVQERSFKKAGQQLRAVREAKGLSQERLSLDAVVDQSSLSKVERLGPQLMGWAQLLRLAEVLDCEIAIEFRPRKV